MLVMLPKNRLSFLISLGKRDAARTSFSSVRLAASEGRQTSGYLVLKAVSKSLMLKALWIEVNCEVDNYTCSSASFSAYPAATANLFAFSGGSTTSTRFRSSA